jgi:signal transduction histidine kinase/DNA-binding response OmpR family regulator
MNMLPHLIIRERILIMSCASTALQQLANLLSQRGYSVQWASSGELGLKAVQTQLPDLILLENNLPDFDSHTIWQKLKAERQTGDIPVIMISSSEELQQRFVEAANYIFKPLQVELALAQIENHFRQRQLQQQVMAQNIQMQMQLQQEVQQREQAEKALEQQQQKILLLRQVTETIRQSNSQPPFETIVQQIGQVFQVSRCSLHFYVPPPMPEIPLIAEFVQAGLPAMQHFEFALEDSLLISEVLSQDRAVAIANVDTDPRLQSIQSFCELAQITALLAVRTSYNNQTNGLITLQQCEQQRAWTADEVFLLEAVAAQIGIAIAQAKSLEQEQKQLEALDYQNSVLRQEICERRQVETALQKSEVEVRSLFAALTDVVLVLDQQGARRERYLAALVEVQRQLLSLQEQQTPYSKILQRLGQVATASRVYLYEKQHDLDGRLIIVQRAEWNAPEVASSLMLAEEVWDRWAIPLARGEIISGTIAQVSEAERRFMKARGSLSILVLPLMVNGEFWGFIGFDDCLHARAWDSLEVSLLSMAATAIGLHYEQKLVEEALRQSAEREQATLRVIEQMRQTLDLEQIFRTTTEELRLLLKCDRVLIYRFKPDWSGEVVAESVAEGWVKVLPPATPCKLTTRSINDHRCVVKTWDGDLSRDTYLRDTQGGVYSRGAKYLCVRDVHQANFAACYIELLDHLQAKAYLTIPIFQGNRLWGLLASYQNSAPRNWQVTEINLVIHISTQLGVALQQADLLAQTQRQSAALEKAKDAAEAANRAKTQFIATMSHELRTPLNSILGFTQLIAQEAVLSAEHQEYLHIISRSGQHLLELINDVLEVAKLEANHTSLQESEFNLYELLESIAAMLRLSVSAKQLQFNMVIAADVAQFIIADKTKLRQVLLNLLDNAVKFTQAGVITLHVCRGTSEGEAYALQFSVADTGFGIAPEEIDWLFEAFVQTEAGRQSNQGTGLGLVISDRLVQRMGGKLQVQSRLGTGSVFEFTIPVQGVTDPADNGSTTILHQRVNSRYDETEQINCSTNRSIRDSAGSLVANRFVKDGSENHRIADNLNAHGLTSNHMPVVKLTPADLSIMPSAWVAELYYAASGCSERQVLKLVEQIPAVYTSLAKDLEALASNFCFAEIVELTQSQISSF